MAIGGAARVKVYREAMETRNGLEEILILRDGRVAVLAP